LEELAGLVEEEVVRRAEERVGVMGEYGGRVGDVEPEVEVFCVFGEAEVPSVVREGIVLVFEGVKEKVGL
jgi:hypothetical protein